MDELDLRREAGAVQRADQVGREHEAALQHRDDEQVLEPGPGDLARQLLVAARDGGLVEKNPDPGRASQTSDLMELVAATVAPGAA